MTNEEARAIIDQYIEKFGGFPYFMMMGMSDEEIAAAMVPCLETGEPLKIDFDPELDY